MWTVTTIASSPSGWCGTSVHVPGHHCQPLGCWHGIAPLLLRWEKNRGRTGTLLTSITVNHSNDMCHHHQIHWSARSLPSMLSFIWWWHGIVVVIVQVVGGSWMVIVGTRRWWLVVAVVTRRRWRQRGGGWEGSSFFVDDLHVMFSANTTTILIIIYIRIWHITIWGVRRVTLTCGEGQGLAVVSILLPLPLPSVPLPSSV